MGKASRRKQGKAETAGPGAAVPASGAPSPPAEAEEAPPWMTRPLGIILAAAALFRAAYFIQYRAGSVFFGSLFLDAAIYDDWARKIAAGAWIPSEPFYFAPGYPYALALVHKLVSSRVEAVYVLQLLLGLANIVFIHRLAALAFGRRAAAAAAAIAALYASLPFLEAKVMSSTLALTLLLVSLVVLAGSASRSRWWLWGTAGILLGATSLVRPETLLAGPFVLLWILRWGSPAAGSWRRAAAASAWLLVGWGAAISPAAILNANAGGGSTLISSQGGITFYQSNNARARGLYVFLSKEGFSGAPERQAREEEEIAERALGRPLTRSEVSSYWFGKGLDFIRERPGRFLWLLGMKLLRFVGSYEYSTEYIIYVERETVWLLWLPFVPFALIVALAVPSIATALRASASGPRAASAGGAPPRSRGLNAAGWLLAITLAANLATVLAFYVSSRYRLPSAPPLIAFAGATAVSAHDAFRRGRRADAYVTAAAVVLVFLLSHFEKDASATIQEANVHFNAGNLWSARKDHEMALHQYRRAVSMNGSFHQYWFNMGNTLRDMKRHAEAADAYGEAARRKPDFFNAHLRRGMMLLEAGDAAGARAALETAESLRPDDFDVHLGIGKAASRLGDREAAVRHLDRAVQIRPDSEAAREERGRL